jgi:hypothetical protein
MSRVPCRRCSGEGAPERGALTGKKVEGRKSHAELHPELVALVRQLRRRRPKGGRRSLREISAELAQQAIDRGDVDIISTISRLA